MWRPGRAKREMAAAATFTAGRVLFDERFYLQRYPDIAAAGLDPWEHYSRFGAAEQRRPLPAFDVDRYTALHPAAQGRALEHWAEMRATWPECPATPDELTSRIEHATRLGVFDASWYAVAYGGEVGTHPFVAYAAHQRTTDPAPMFDTARLLARHPALPTTPTLAEQAIGYPPDDFLRALPARSRRTARIAEDEPLKVCVVVHAFYPELIDDLLAPLAMIAEHNPTVLVSVADVEASEHVHAAIDRCLGAVPRQVRVCPNRGRNFGPMFSAFRDDIAAHDLLLHLHTKRSLASGTEQSAWRTHLTRTLSSPALRVIEAFQADRQLGAVLPSRFEGVPAWAGHWLKNEAHGRALYERMGLDPSWVRGYVPYPVGGMFWARTAALAPLLRAVRGLDDFEVEDGQADGTLAHAIERCIAASAVAGGFEFGELAPDGASLDVRPDLSSSEAVGRFDPHAFADAVEGARLVTVDLFDTLLLRPALRPHDLVRRAARQAGDIGLATVRREAEDGLRRALGGAGDVTLGEITSALRTLTPLADSLLDEELAVEHQLLTVRQDLVTALREVRRAGCRTVLMSDTTWPRSIIEDLLHRAGLGDLFDQLYVSNDCRARKDDGTMWALVAAAEDVDRAHWVHVGDNEQSDIQQASDHGVRWYYVAAPARGEELAAGQQLARFDDLGTSLILGRAACGIHAGARAWPHASLDDDVERFAYGVLGPLVLAGTTWAAAQGDGPRTMLYLARDTWPMWRLHQRLAAAGADLPHAGYLRASRSAAISAAQADGLRAELLLDDAISISLSVRGLLRARAGLALAATDSRFDEPLSLTADSERLHEHLHELESVIVAHGQREREALRGRLDALGVGDDHTLVVVDLGYSATIQRALVHCVPNRLEGRYLATFERAQLAAGPRSSVRSYFQHNERDEQPFLIRQLLLHEALLCEPVPSQVRFSDPDPEPGDELPNAAMVRRVHDRLLDFCDDILTTVGWDAVSSGVDPRAIDLHCGRAWGGILAPLPELFGSLVVDNDFNAVAHQRAVTDD